MLHDGKFHTTQKQDQALVIDYFSRSAEVLLKHDVITEKLTGEFRLSLRDPVLLDKLLASEATSLLTRLVAQQSEFLIGLCGRFGELSLFTNLLRYSLQHPLTQLQTDLHCIGQDLLKKSELIFNRSIYLYRNQNCEAQVLASSLLIDISEELAEAARAIHRVQQRIHRIAACQLHFRRDQDDQIDQVLAQALGFNGVRLESLPFRAENQALAELKHIMTRIVDVIRQALDQVRRNDRQQNILPALSRLDRLKAETHKLEALPMNPDDDLVLWESRRLLWLESMEQLHHHLLGLGHDLGQILKSSSFQPETQKYPLTASMHRRLLGDMVASGLNPREALEATSALIGYCEQRNLRPSRLVSTELKKIHPMLSEQSLKLLQEMDIDRSLAKQSGQEKKWILDRSTRLMATFKANIGTLIILAALLLPGCGLKTPPSSQIEDFRPGIPYQVPAWPKSQKEGPKTEASDPDLKNQEESSLSPTIDNVTESP